MQFKETRPLYKLAEITAFLRSENGCSWDKVQGSLSLRKYLLEETYETIDAIESGNPSKIVEELGDLLYQVYALAQIASESNLFTIDNVADEITTKLIRRHPHVFGNETFTKNETPEDIWEFIKKKEKCGKESILSGVPSNLPALLKAYIVQEKTLRIGFDWDKPKDAQRILRDGISKFNTALHNGCKEDLLIEIGDIFFILVNIARLMKIDPEDALHQSIKKFIERFISVEKKSQESINGIKKITHSETDEFCNEENV